MDKVFPTGYQEQLIGLVPRSLLETCCKMDWFRFIFRLLEAYFACYKGYSYLLYMPSCLFVDFCSCFAVEIQKLNSNSKKCLKCKRKSASKGLRNNIHKT